MEILLAVEYKDKQLYNSVKKAADSKFSQNSYVKNLWILKEYKKRGGKVSYENKTKPKNQDIKKQISGEEIVVSYCKDCEENSEGIAIDELEAKEAQKKLNKPFRTPGGPKKFSVYVKNDKGNIVKVNFGDPNMEIKRDNPARRKNYRARHNCQNPGPKWKANYWSCKMWSTKPVGAIASENQIPEAELNNLKEDLSKMVIGSLAAIKVNSEAILNNLDNQSVKENLSEPFLQQMAALAEDYVTTIHNYVMFSIQEPLENKATE